MRFRGRRIVAVMRRLFLALLISLQGTTVVARDRAINAIHVIAPYKQLGLWMFDDARVGLFQEPFVSGADRMIDNAVADIENAESGFVLLFSSNAFPGHQIILERGRAEAGGHWYYSPQFKLDGWLCPALFKYFETAPQTIYVQVRSKQ
jgi:hypothetical protein